MTRNYFQLLESVFVFKLYWTVVFKAVHFIYLCKDINKSEGTSLLGQLWENIASCSEEKGHNENSEELRMNFQSSAYQFLIISTTSYFLLR